MEFFDINYCQALIESNKSEDISYKIEELKNIKNRYINESLRIELKLKCENLENISVCKKSNLIIIKNIIENYRIKQEIKNLNVDLKTINIFNNTFYKKILKTNTNINIIDNIVKKIIQDNNGYDLSILKLQKLFNFKVNKKIKYMFNYLYNDLKQEILLFNTKKTENDNNKYLYTSQVNMLVSNIKIILYNISQIHIKNELTLEIISFVKNKTKAINTKNKLIALIKKKNKQMYKLKSNIEKNILIYNKKQKDFDKKIKKLYMQFMLISTLINKNQSIINKYREHIKLNKNKKKINNNMNKNYNKCKKFNKNDDIICSICLEQIEEGIITSCKHTFHLECINLYVNNILNNPIINIICPMCRAYI
jgi:hypothetical protein